MHQIHFLLGLRPRPRWRSLQCSPNPCLSLRGLLLRGWRETGEGEEKVKGKEGKRWREGFGPPENFGVAPPMTTAVRLIAVTENAGLENTAPSKMQGQNTMWVGWLSILAWSCIFDPCILASLFRHK